MLEPYRQFLSAKKIILASSSPRRKEIFETILNLTFEVKKSDFEEDLNKSEFTSPQEYAKTTALHKTIDIVKRCIEEKTDNLPDIVVGADTVVYLDGDIIEKPKDYEDAVNILKRLSGRKHGVCTGVVLMVIRDSDQHRHDNHVTDIDLLYDSIVFHETSQVEFDDLSEELIRLYAGTGEPMDKAGGYGIQGIGGTLIKGISGDYFNVMGFPANRFAKELTNYIKNKQKPNQ